MHTTDTTTAFKRIDANKMESYTTKRDIRKTIEVKPIIETIGYQKEGYLAKRGRPDAALYR